MSGGNAVQDNAAKQGNRRSQDKRAPDNLPSDF